MTVFARPERLLDLRELRQWLSRVGRKQQRRTLAGNFETVIVVFQGTPLSVTFLGQRFDWLAQDLVD